MPALANIVVNDRATTPVAHTFTPRAPQGDVAIYVESTGIPKGDRRFTMSVRELNGGKYRCRLVLTNPVLVTETINGVASPKLARTAFAAVEFTFDAYSTEQERKDTIGLLANALAASVTQVNDSFTKLEGVF